MNAQYVTWTDMYCRATGKIGNYKNLIFGKIELCIFVFVQNELNIEICEKLTEIDDQYYDIKLKKNCSFWGK